MSRNFPANDFIRGQNPSPTPSRGGIGNDDSAQAPFAGGSSNAPQTTGQSLGQVADSNFNRPSGAKRPPKLLRGESEIKSARNMDLYMVHSTAFELRTGDTLVFVDLPSAPKDAKSQADCDGIAYKSQKFRVHSEKLLATGSSRFSEMLGPSYQFRIQRRRKMVKKLPEGVKYLLDLTPPSEGDELVFEMTELSLTPGIMRWWTSCKFHRVDPSLVAGHDDVCVCTRQATPAPEADHDEGSVGSQGESKKASVHELADDTVQPTSDAGTSKLIPPTPDMLMKLKADGVDAIYKTPSFREVPDYCLVRHRNAIIRLLILIEGRDILLDSASRVWTLVGVAKILDCPHVVRDRVVQWLMHGTNMRFIEVLPEEALRIGFALELPQVTQCAFRILVNEMALREAATDGAKRDLSRTTLFGRRLGECGDELDNLIQHAARALIERVSLTISQLQSPDLFDYWNIQQWSKLRRLELLLTREDELNFQMVLGKLHRLMAALQNAVTLNFNDAAIQNVRDQHSVLWSMDLDRATYVLPQDFEMLSEILKGTTLVQKLLCPFIYNEFGEQCEWPLFQDLNVSRGPANRPWYANLLSEVVEALGDATLDRPAAMASDEWAEFLDTQKPFRGSIKHYSVKIPLLDLDDLDLEVKEALRPITLCWVRHDIDPPLNITRHMLLTLTINEMKFLPLWAGGFDDGTGGVFETFVPPTDMGPDGPGPAYHTGHTLPSAAPSTSGSMIDDMSTLRVKGTITDASIDVHDSISTVYRPNKVITDDVSIMSDAFTANTSEFQEAKFAIPAEHQGAGQAVDAMVESGMDFESVAGDGFDDVGKPFSDVSDSDDSMVMI